MPQPATSADASRGSGSDLIGLLMETSSGQFSMDRRQNLLDRPQDLIVPEAEHAVTLRFQPCRPQVIACFGRDVLTAVELDDQASVKAGEVGNVPTERNLAAKVAAGQLLSAEVAPEQRFCLGRLLAPPAGEADFSTQGRGIFSDLGRVLCSTPTPPSPLKGEGEWAAVLSR